MFHKFTSYKASRILLHSTGRLGDLWVLQLEWPEDSVDGPQRSLWLSPWGFTQPMPYSNRLPGSSLAHGWNEEHFWEKRGVNMMISLFDPWKRKISRFKNQRNHQPTSVYPLRTSAERICTEPPATTRLANSCGSSGLHTWFDLKMGYTLPETASWVEDNENKPWKLGIPWDKPKYFKCLQPRTRIDASISQPSEIEGHQSPAGSNTLRQEGYQMRMMPIILKLKIIGLKENLYSWFTDPLTLAISSYINPS